MPDNDLISGKKSVSKKGKAFGTNDPVTPVTEAALDEAVEKLAKVIQNFGKPVWAMITLVVLALLIGLISVLVSSYALVMESNNFKTDAFNSLREQMVDFNQNIIEASSTAESISDIRKQFQQLREKNPYLR